MMIITAVKNSSTHRIAITSFLPRLGDIFVLYRMLKEALLCYAKFVRISFNVILGNRNIVLLKEAQFLLIFFLY